MSILTAMFGPVRSKCALVSRKGGISPGTFIRAPSISKEICSSSLPSCSLPVFEASRSRPAGMKTDMAALVTEPPKRLSSTQVRGFEAIQNGHNCLTTVVSSLSARPPKLISGELSPSFMCREPKSEPCGVDIPRLSNWNSLVVEKNRPVARPSKLTGFSPEIDEAATPSLMTKSMPNPLPALASMRSRSIKAPENGATVFRNCAVDGAISRVW